MFGFVTLHQIAASAHSVTIGNRAISVRVHSRAVGPDLPRDCQLDARPSHSSARPFLEARKAPMPSSVITFAELAARLPDTVTVACNRCDRRGELNPRTGFDCPLMPMFIDHLAAWATRVGQRVKIEGPRLATLW